VGFRVWCSTGAVGGFWLNRTFSYAGYRIRTSENAPSPHLGEYVGRVVGWDALVGVDYAPRLHEHASLRRKRSLEGEKGGIEQQRVRG
jgi:hypothetical protein